MKHQVVPAGHEWQDPESGERTDDFHDVCIICGEVDAKESDDCPGRKEEDDAGV